MAGNSVKFVADEKRKSEIKKYVFPVAVGRLQSHLHCSICTIISQAVMFQEVVHSINICEVEVRKTRPPRPGP
jgi:hypothetical protein